MDGPRSHGYGARSGYDVRTRCVRGCTERRQGVSPGQAESAWLLTQARACTPEHQLRSRKDSYMSNFLTPLEEVIHHNVIKNNKTGGPALDIGPMQLLWRALGEHTGYMFSIFETTVVPGMGIPLHKHPFAEFFYVLEGTLAIGSWNNQGAVEWDVYESGESLVVQPNAPHTFLNKSGHPCRLLSVSTYH